MNTKFLGSFSLIPLLTFLLVYIGAGIWFICTYRNNIYKLINQHIKLNLLNTLIEDKI